MRTRKLLAALITTLVLGSTTAAVRAQEEPRRERTQGVPTTLRPLVEQAEVSRSVSRAERIPLRRTLARCTTLRCINKTFKGLIRAHNSLVSAHNALAGAHVQLEAFILNCFGTLGVTQWGNPFGAWGYLWDEDGDGASDFDTSALDLDDPAFSDFLLLGLIC